jgi:hypothetical protein
MGGQTFDAEFYELPDGTVTVVVRAHWPSADDIVEVLRRSVRLGPKRAGRQAAAVSRSANTLDKCR